MKLKIILSYVAATLTGILACQLVNFYVARNAKTPENCVRQLKQYFSKEFDGLTPQQQAEESVGLYDVCHLVNDDYKEAIHALEVIRNSH